MVFSQAVQVRRMIQEIASNPKQTFWIMTINLLADTAALEWSKVFGSWDEATHWKRLVPIERHDEVRAALLSAVRLDLAAWKLYRSSVVGYRNQMVAHNDLGATPAKYPDYDAAILAANFMFEQLRAIADPDQLGGITTSLDGWSQTVARNMKMIVRKAFEASATLGSNVPISSRT